MITQAALDYRIWQGIYAAIFSLAGVAALGLVAPFVASRGLFKPFFRRIHVEPSVPLLSVGRSEALLKELEDARQKKEWALGIVSAYQSIRKELAASAGVRLRKDLTEHEAVERLAWSRGLGTAAANLRHLYTLYEKARFGAEPAGEADLDQTERLVVELSSQLKEPSNFPKEDVGQP